VGPMGHHVRHAGSTGQGAVVDSYEFMTPIPGGPIDLQQFANEDARPFCPFNAPTYDCVGGCPNNVERACINGEED
jgi:hypothetical protein